MELWVFRWSAEVNPPYMPRRPERRRKIMHRGSQAGQGEAAAGCDGGRQNSGANIPPNAACCVSADQHGQAALPGKQAEDFPCFCCYAESRAVIVWGDVLKPKTSDGRKRFTGAVGADAGRWKTCNGYRVQPPSQHMHHAPKSQCLADKPRFRNAVEASDTVAERPDRPTPPDQRTSQARMHGIQSRREETEDRYIRS